MKFCDANEQSFSKCFYQKSFVHHSFSRGYVVIEILCSYKDSRVR
jgi:hypothetical protein